MMFLIYEKLKDNTTMEPNTLVKERPPHQSENYHDNIHNIIELQYYI